MRIQKLLCLVLSMAIASVAQAEDLMGVYELALRNDPTLEVAKETQKAIQEALPQAQAQLIPNVNASVSLLKNHTTQRLNPTLSKSNQSYTTNDYAVTLNQPIYHFEHWALLAQAGDTVKAAKMSYFAAEQDLILRTAERYFAVLQAEDVVTFAKARRKAFGRFLDQSEQRYKVGLIAVTDVQIARARHDNAYSQEIAAETELYNQKERLREIVCVQITQLSGLRDTIKLVPPCPMDMEQWVSKSIAQNLELQASRYLAGAAKADIKVKRAAHLPTVDMTGQYQHNGITTPFITKGGTRSLGVRINLPVFSGGSVSSKTRQSVHNFLKADSEYEVLHRTTESLARQSYRSINTEIDQVNALKQAVASNQSALKATEDSFNVGTRTIVDVLNSQSDLIKAQQDLSVARYNYILDSLRLKKAAGILCPTDLQHINAWLKN
jgi:outer membrane protein